MSCKSTSRLRTLSYSLLLTICSSHATSPCITLRMILIQKQLNVITSACIGVWLKEQAEELMAELTLSMLHPQSTILKKLHFANCPPMVQLLKELGTTLSSF